MGFGAAGVKEFIKLDDTPGSYSGEGGKFTRVKTAEDGLEMASALTGVTVRKNTQMPVVGARPQLNFMEGAAINLSVEDNPPDNEIDVAIHARYPTRYSVFIPEDATLPTVNPPALAMVDGANYSYHVLDYDKDTEEKAYWGDWLTPDYQEESIIIDIFWISVAAAGDVKWGAQVLGRAKGEAYDAALGSEKIVTTPTGGAGVLNHSRIDSFSPNWAGQDEIRIKIARKVLVGLLGDARITKVVARYTGKFAQSFYPLAAEVDITPAVGSWQVVNLASYIPIGATGVVLNVSNTGAVRGIGFRKKGSTDNILDTMMVSSQLGAFCGVDENRQLEIYIGSITQTVWLVAYTASGVVFFDNGYLRKPTVDSVWEPIVLSDILPSDAIGVIVEAIGPSAGPGFGIRKTGSASTKWGSLGKHIWAICGVDGAQSVDLKLQDVAESDIWILGYVTSGAVFPTDPATKSVVGIGAYETLGLTAECPSAIMVFFAYYAVSNVAYALRKHGDTGDQYLDTQFGHAWKFFPCDANQDIDAKVEHASFKTFHIVGYAQWAGA